MNIERQPLQPLRALWRTAVAAACLAVAAHAAAQGAAQPAAAPAAVFAKVGERVISGEQYEAAFAQAARGKFYHGQPPQNAVALLQREVGQKLVDEILLEAEAKRRKLQPDAAAVQKTIAGYEQRYKDSAQWKANRERVLPGLKAKLEHDNVLEQLTAQVKGAAAPTPEQLRKYYDDHRDKFTSPEQSRVRVILLKVDPSAPKEQWDGAKAEGAAIAKRLRGGADFAELANLHSADESSKRGGDMGFMHRGTLPEVAQTALDALQPGQVTDPVVLLEGVAVFRLDERKTAELRPLEAVGERAKELYLREKGEEAWAALLAKLRRDTPVQLDESRFLPLAASAGDNAPAR